MRVLRLAVVVLATVDENSLKPKAAELASANPKEMDKRDAAADPNFPIDLENLDLNLGDLFNEEKMEEMKQQAGPAFEKLKKMFLQPQGEGDEECVECEGVAKLLEMFRGMGPAPADESDPSADKGDSSADEVKFNLDDLFDAKKLQELQQQIAPMVNDLMKNFTPPQPQQAEDGKTPEAVSESDDAPEKKMENAPQPDFNLADLFNEEKMAEIQEQIQEMQKKVLPMIQQFGPIVQNLMKQFAPPSTEVETPEAKTTVANDSDFVKMMEGLQDEENLMFDRFYLEAMAEEFKDVLPFTVDELKEVIAEEAEKADTNKDGKIDAREVVERLKVMVIEQVDADKDGAVSEQEVLKVARAILENMGVKANDDQIGELIRALDKNGDGKVTPEELE